ncbi:MAG: murein biosynthesis integral membrane protein MurJ [Bryobacteraceae bacterium]
MQVRIRISRPAPAPTHTLQTEPSFSPVSPDVSPRLVRRPQAPLGGSSLVALGILLSRLTGLIRERVIGHFFGVSVVADAFRAAIRIPNLLNNLFGEGVLSASFVTVYSKLRALDKAEEAEHVAAAVFGILSVVCSVLVVAGISLTPILIDLIAPGFKGDERALTIHIVRILFPGTGLLVMSAWCLGVLNSHRRFLLSYTAPVAVNICMILALLAYGPHSPQDRLALDLAWAFVLGSALQFLLQVPRVLQFLPGFRPAFEVTSEHVRSVIRNFGPIFLSRGVVQISAYIDSMIASWLPSGAVAALGYGQVISILPISLFSMSVSAAELPALSSAVGTQDEIATLLRRRLSTGLRRIAFFIIPSAVAFLVLGDVLTAALYQSGHFHHQDAVYVWSVLAGSAVGLLATSLGRLYSSAFYALLDTRTPLRFAVIRVLLTTGLGFLFALQMPHWLGIDQKWGIAGLTASAGIAGWVEFALLRHSLGKRIGKTPLSSEFTLKLWFIAFLAAALCYSIKNLLGSLGPAHPLFLAAIVLPVYGAGYFGGTLLAGVKESRTTLDSVLGRLRV